MQLNDLQPKTKRSVKKRVGRGGKRGKTSGRGMKGQKSRSGHSLRPAVRDTIKKLPKLRGHGQNRSRTVNPSVTKPLTVNLSAIERVFVEGECVSPVSLREKQLIRPQKSRRGFSVKILGNGSLSKKLSVSGCSLSSKARREVEAQGGEILETKAKQKQ